MNADEAEIRRREAARWLAIGEEDVRVSRGCLVLNIPAPGSAAYHCQQAAEKVIKGLLVVAGATFARTHDMDELVDLALVHYPNQKSSFEAVRRLTLWGVAYRYPGPEDVSEPVPTDAEIAAVLDRIEALAATLHSAISGTSGRSRS